MNSPHRHERNKQAEKQGQTSLNQFGKHTIRHTITPTITPRPAMVGLISAPKDSIQKSLGSEKPVKLLSIHKIPFVYNYEGVQPTRDAYSVRKLGKTGTARQVYYWWDEEKAGIQVFTNCFMIWLKHPKGMTLDEQLGECRERADSVARKFGMKYGLGNITLKSEPPSETTPDVIVEDKSVAKVLKPIVKAGAVPGIGINQTSHKGKVETGWNKGKELEFVLGGGIEARFDKLEEHLERITSILDRIFPEGAVKEPTKPEWRDYR